MGALINILKTAGPRLAAVLRGNVPLMERIALRLKLPTKGITPEKILAVVKSNALAAVLVFNEVFGKQDYDAIAVTAAVDNGMDIVSRLSFQVDTVTEGDVKQSSKFDDEFEVISSAIGILGSLDRLMIVAKAAQMPQELFSQYRRDATKARSLRL